MYWCCQSGLSVLTWILPGVNITVLKAHLFHYFIWSNPVYSRDRYLYLYSWEFRKVKHPLKSNSPLVNDSNKNICFHEFKAPRLRVQSRSTRSVNLTRIRYLKRANSCAGSLCPLQASWASVISSSPLPQFLHFPLLPSSLQRPFCSSEKPSPKTFSTHITFLWPLNQLSVMTLSFPRLLEFT